MVKKMICIVVGLFILLGLAACSSSKSSNTEDQSKQATTESASPDTSKTQDFPKMTITLQLGDTETSDIGQAFKTQVKDAIEKETDGKVTVEIYYNNSLYAQDQVIPAMNQGNLDMIPTQAPFLADYLPEFGMISSAYMFKDLDHLNKFYASDVGQNVLGKLQDATGLHYLSHYYQGAREVSLTIDRKVTKRADFADLKLRMPNSESWLFMGEALGGNPIGIGFNDTYMALQTGTVDGQDNPLSNTISQSFYELTKSITMTNHMLLDNMVFIGQTKWESMTPELQKIVQDAVTNVGESLTNHFISAQKEEIDFLNDKGIKIYDLTDAEASAYRQEVIDYYFSTEAGKKITGTWDMNLYNQIQDIVK